MSNRRPAEGKVQLTERGCEALAAWMKLRHIQKTDLADAMGTNQMAPTRMLKRQGFLTLEQAGRLVAFAGGELTAEQLVGADRSAAVPTYPLKVRVRHDSAHARVVELLACALLASRDDRVKLLFPVKRFDELGVQVVDVQIVSLRRKLGQFGKYIETVRGVGYRFKD